jgi:hypothetical protein
MNAVQSFSNEDFGLRADVFQVGTRHRVRLVDIDCDEVIQSFVTFRSLDAALTYARKLVS